VVDRCAFAAGYAPDQIGSCAAHREMTVVVPEIMAIIRTIAGCCYVFYPANSATEEMP
jgi:hypothetical protein